MSKNLLLFFFLLPVFVGAQNLVLNPSFEEKDSCPNIEGQINKALHWISFGNTPDYYHSCCLDTFISQPYVGVPNNFYGEQDAADGTAYGGLIGYYQASNNHREIIGGILSLPLGIGTRYYAGLKISLADHSTFAIDKIGMSFSTVQFDDFSNLAPINNQATVYSSSIISDSVNWASITGSFIADSPYQYIMLGNFFTDQNTDTFGVNLSSIWNTAYYYIDAVYVSTDSLCCFTDISFLYKDYKLNLFPNPVNSTINISSSVGFSKVLIYNLLGKEVLNLTKDSYEISIDISMLSDGIYILMEQSNNYLSYKKFLVKK